MNNKNKYWILSIFGVANFAAGMFVATLSAETTISNNSIQGYHCTPITKHIGIKSAKAQVEAYQAMIKG